MLWLFLLQSNSQLLFLIHCLFPLHTEDKLINAETSELFGQIDDLKEVDDEKLNALGVTDIESGNAAPRIRIVKESYILDAIYIVTVIATMGYNMNH